MSRQIVDLFRFVPLVTPRYHEPRHLLDLVHAFDRIARGASVHACVSTPPRHEKSETLGHGVAWLLRQRPALRVAYVTHGATLAAKKSRGIRAIAERARVPLDPKASSAHDWRTGVHEGGLWATSIGGSLVGEGFDLVIVDDPVKDRVTAESSLARERLASWFSDVLLPRCEPGASVIVCMHRWHPDDLIGRLESEGGWEVINLPALDDLGFALCPERFDERQLAEIRTRIGEYAWASLYMGQPRPRGGALFADVHHYDALPERYRVAIGVDLAYSAKTRADYSVAVVLAIAPDETRFVLDVVRRQVAAPDFAASLALLRARYPGASFASYVSGTERGSLDFFARAGVPVAAMTARADKFTRAQLTAAAWNAGRILLPRERRWVNAFVEELAGFTGVHDRHDDQVDALVSAFDATAGHARGAAMVAALRAAARNGSGEAYEPDAAPVMTEAEAHARIASYLRPAVGAD